MSDIRLDYGDLSSAARALDEVKQLLDRANQDTDEAARHCGHAGLARKIDEFSGHWKVKRGELAESVALLAAAVTAVHDTFLDLDVEIAAKVRSGQTRMANAGTIHAGRAQAAYTTANAARPTRVSGGSGGW